MTSLHGGRRLTGARTGVMIIVAVALALAPRSHAGPPSRTQAYVAVADAKGLPVANLAAADFAVTIDGRDATVRGLQPAAGPLSVVFVVEADLSNLPYLRVALQVMLDALAHADPATRVGLMHMANQGVTFTTPGRFFVNDRLTASLVSGAPLLSGVAEGAKALGQERTRRRVVVAIDQFGPPQLDTTMIGQEVDALRDTATALWGVEIGSAAANGRTPTERTMTTVTQLSGGASETVLDIQSLAPAAKRVIALLLSEYVITFDGTSDSGRHALRVGVRRPGVKVFAPTWAAQ